MEIRSLQTQISAIMEVLAKAAVAEISQLLQEDAAALHLEIRRRNEEIRSLKSRLTLTESRLKSLTAGGCSVGVQVHISDTECSREQHKKAQPKTLNGLTSHGQEMLVLTAPTKDPVLEEKPHIFPSPELSSPPLKHEDPRSAPHPEEDELSSLELQMKIEQVEELVDPKITHEDDVWSSEKDLNHQIESEQHSQNIPDPYMMMMMMEEDPGATSSLSAVLLENDRNDTDFDLLHQDTSQRPSPRSDRVAAPQTNNQNFAQEDPRLSTGHKPFRCEECGKSFTQRTRLITHRRVHTGEKPFRCQLCGKMFSRQDNCLRHMRLHSGQRW